MLKQCVLKGCGGLTLGTDALCPNCRILAEAAKIHNKNAEETITRASDKINNPPMHHERRNMAQLYPKYYKRVPKGVTELDVYAVCDMFPIDDPSGAINHARKKLLVPGTRTGGKSMYKDIKEARDTLNRWLEIYEQRDTDLKAA